MLPCGSLPARNPLREPAAKEDRGSCQPESDQNREQRAGARARQVRVADRRRRGEARVVLHLRPTVSWPAELDLLAHVEVAQRSDARTGPVDFLEALDPLEVERAALARTDLENVPGGATAAVLRQLAEWAHGA